MAGTIFEATGGVKVVFNGEVVAEVDNLTIDALKRIAKEQGVKKFTVVDSNGEELTASDFPVTDGEVTIKPYYEAK